MKRTPDDDMMSAFEHNQPQPFTLDQVDDILACIAGHNDEDDWYWIVQLKDGSFYLIDAGCDYTGWDCNSSCTCIKAATAKECAESVEEKYSDRKIKKQLLAQLAGTQPYGLENK